MDKKLIVDETISKVCELLKDVTEEQIRSKIRTYKVASARQLVYWCLWHIRKMGYNEIGRVMGKNHATVMYGVREADTIISRNITKEDHRIYNAAQGLKEAFMSIEDKLIADINATKCEFDGDKASVHVDFVHGDLQGSVHVVYSTHFEDNYIDLNGISYRESTSQYVDDLENIEIECWDTKSEVEVPVDVEYIRQRV